MKKIITRKEFCEELNSIVEKAGLKATCQCGKEGVWLFYIRASREKYVTALCEIAVDALKVCEKVVGVRFTKPWLSVYSNGAHYVAEVKGKLSAKYHLRDLF